MTNDQTVTQALEPCPFCGGVARIETTRHQHPPSHWVECAECEALSGEYASKASAVAAWNTRTAHSGEGRDYAEAFDILVDVQSALVLTADYSDGATVSSFVSSSTQYERLNRFLHERQYADPRPDGEGRSNGAGEDGYLKIPTEAMPRGPRRDAVVAAAMKLAPYSADPAGTPTRDGLVFLNAAINEAAAAHFAALSAPQGEVGRLREVVSQAARWFEEYAVDHPEGLSIRRLPRAGQPQRQGQAQSGARGLSPRRPRSTRSGRDKMSITVYADRSEYSFEYFKDGKAYAAEPDYRCPTCDSPSPERHPAMQHGGEVELCTDAYHLIPTAGNRPSYIAAVEAKRAAQPEAGGEHE
jgi:Lar family restriction alleviation protein